MKEGESLAKEETSAVHIVRRFETAGVVKKPLSARGVIQQSYQLVKELQILRGGREKQGKKRDRSSREDYAGVHVS